MYIYILYRYCILHIHAYIHITNLCSALPVHNYALSQVYGLSLYIDVCAAPSQVCLPMFKKQN